MYGMVNEAMRTFVELHHDEQTWQTICGKAGLDKTTFERLTSYDDAVTYNLVGAICDHTGLTAHEALEGFGTYFIDYAGRSPLGNLMRLAGKTFVERVRGLDEMHERVALTMPFHKPPSFELEEVGPQTYHLFYYSEREGLAPMVIGLLHGLAQDTGERISVRHVTPKSDTQDHDLFEVTLLTG